MPRSSGAIVFAAMRRYVVCLAVLCLSVTVMQAQDRNAEELNRLQGAWTVTAAEQNGRPFDAIKGGVLTIAERNFTLRTASGNELKGELRVDAAASPRHLDLVHTGGPVWEAIYTADGDLFRLNYVEADGRSKRPTLFATSADAAGTVIVMRRAPTP